MSIKQYFSILDFLISKGPYIANPASNRLLDSELRIPISHLSNPNIYQPDPSAAYKPPPHYSRACRERRRHSNSLYTADAILACRYISPRPLAHICELFRLFRHLYITVSINKLNNCRNSLNMHHVTILLR